MRCPFDAVEMGEVHDPLEPVLRAVCPRCRRRYDAAYNILSSPQAASAEPRPMRPLTAQERAALDRMSWLRRLLHELWPGLSWWLLDRQFRRPHPKP